MNIRNNVIAVIGLILLIPILIAIPHYISVLSALFESIDAAQGDAKNTAGMIASYIVHQIQVVIVLIPGIIVCSITIFGLRFNPK